MRTCRKKEQVYTVSKAKGLGRNAVKFDRVCIYTKWYILNYKYLHLIKEKEDRIINLLIIISFQKTKKVFDRTLT